MQRDATAYLDGRAAYADGVALEDNPYPPHEREARTDWTLGWLDCANEAHALRRAG